MLLILLVKFRSACFFVRAASHPMSLPLPRPLLSCPSSSRHPSPLPHYRWWPPSAVASVPPLSATAPAIMALLSATLVHHHRLKQALPPPPISAVPRPTAFLAPLLASRATTYSPHAWPHATVQNFYFLKYFLKTCHWLCRDNSSNNIDQLPLPTILGVNLSIFCHQNLVTTYDYFVTEFNLM